MHPWVSGRGINRLLGRAGGTFALGAVHPPEQRGANVALADSAGTIAIRLCPLSVQDSSLDRRNDSLGLSQGTKGGSASLHNRFIRADGEDRLLGEVVGMLIPLPNLVRETPRLRLHSREVGGYPGWVAPGGSRHHASPKVSVGALEQVLVIPVNDGRNAIHDIPIVDVQGLRVGVT